MGKQILLIDDDFDEQIIFNEAIKVSHEDIKCLFANSAKQGLALLEVLTPDFIFLDINMPAVNGYQCLVEIRKKNELKDVPVFIYSTGVDASTTPSAIALGASACIKKDSSIGALADKLRSILRYNKDTAY